MPLWSQPNPLKTEKYGPNPTKLTCWLNPCPCLVRMQSSNANYAHLSINKPVVVRSYQWRWHRSSPKSSRAISLCGVGTLRHRRWALCGSVVFKCNVHVCVVSVLHMVNTGIPACEPRSAKTRGPTHYPLYFIMICWAVRMSVSWPVAHRRNEYSQCLGRVASALPRPAVYIRNLPQQSPTVN